MASIFLVGCAGTQRQRLDERAEKTDYRNQQPDSQTLDYHSQSASDEYDKLEKELEDKIDNAETEEELKKYSEQLETVRLKRFRPLEYQLQMIVIEYEKIEMELEDKIARATTDEERDRYSDQLLTVRLRKIDTISELTQQLKSQHQQHQQHQQHHVYIKQKRPSMVEGWIYNAGNAAIRAAIWKAIFR